MNTDYEYGEIKKILGECQDAVQRRDYSHANECLDRVYYLNFDTLLRCGEIISKLEDTLKEIETFTLTQEKKESVKELIGQAVLSMKGNYAKISAELREMQEIQQKYDLTNAPVD